MSSWAVSRNPNRHRDTFTKSTTIISWYQSTGSRTSALPASRNKSSSGVTVLSIPGEIIAEVFRLAQLRDTEEMFGPLDDWCWISVTHVCKLWRSIALDTQDLWTCIEAGKHSGVEQTEVYLARSGTSELVVHYDTPGTVTDEYTSLQCFFLALTHIHRVRELYIWSFPDIQGTHHLHTVLFRNPAPVLQKFTLHTHSTEIYDLKALFQGHVPKLTDLSLLMHSPSWVYAPYMRYLKRMCFGNISYPLTLEETIAILSECPALEIFSITSIQNVDLCDHREKSRSLPTSIQLPALKGIEVAHANYATIGLLLNSIDSQNIQSWRICCWNYPIKRSPAVDPKSVIPYNASRSSRKCKSLKLTIEYSSAEIRADSPKELDFVDNDDLPQRSITYSYSGTGNITVFESFGFISSIIEGGFWCSAIELTVRMDKWTSHRRDLQDPITSESAGHLPWITLLRMLPHLQILSVDRSDVSKKDFESATMNTHRGLFRALKSTSTEEDGNTQLICPCLRELRLCGMKLDIGVSDLVEVLGFRASRGKQLRRLEISMTPGLREEDLVLMEQSGISGVIDIIYF